MDAIAEKKTDPIAPDVKVTADAIYSATSIGEMITKAAFMEAFPGKVFTKIRPVWLKGLELDGYCAEYNIGFEYNGRQHYVYNARFHNGDIKVFEAQLVRDKRKLEMCTARGVKLMVIPYTTPMVKIREAVQTWLVKAGFKPRKTADSDIDFVRKAIASHGAVLMKDLRAKVLATGFKLVCVGTTELGHNSYLNLTVVCPNKHQYDVIWDNFNPSVDPTRPRKGCAKCHHAKVGTIRRGNTSPWQTMEGLQLIETYKNQSTLHSWICAEKHEIKASFNALKQRKPGSACTQCSFVKIEDYRGVAVQTKNAHLLKPTDPLKWVCLYCNHAFSASLIAVHRRIIACPQKCE